jgi:hypothetical protein
MVFEHAAWIIGCVNMAASLGFSAFAHHGEKFFKGDMKVVESMHRAVGVH